MMRLIGVVATAAALAIVTYYRSRGDNRGGGGNGSGGQEQSVQRDPFANRLEKLHQMMNRFFERFMPTYTMPLQSKLSTVPISRLPGKRMAAGTP